MRLVLLCELATNTQNAFLFSYILYAVFLSISYLLATVKVTFQCYVKTIQQWLAA